MQWKWDERKIRIQVSHLCSKDSSLKYVSCFMGGISGATHALSTNLPHKSSLYIFTCFGQRQTIKHARITWQPISSGISLCHPFSRCSARLCLSLSLLLLDKFSAKSSKAALETDSRVCVERGLNMPTVPILIRIFHPANFHFKTIFSLLLYQWIEMCRWFDWNRFELVIANSHFSLWSKRWEFSLQIERD